MGYLGICLSWLVSKAQIGVYMVKMGTLTSEDWKLVNERSVERTKKLNPQLLLDLRYWWGPERAELTLQKIILTTYTKDRSSQKRRKRKWKLQKSKGGDVGSSETQCLTERDGETAKGRRRKGTKGGKVEGREKRENSCKEKRD